MTQTVEERIDGIVGGELSFYERSEVRTIIRQALLAERQRGRLEGLEEAAKRIDLWWNEEQAVADPVEIIRSLKDKQP